MAQRILDVQFPVANPSGATSASGENIPSSPNMFGGLAAQATEQFGQGAERAGNTVVDFATEKQSQLNAVDAAQRHTDAVKKMTDINAGYLSTEGHAALLARPDHDEKIKGVYDDALANASNDAVKRTLATTLSGDLDRYYNYSSRHSAEQEKVYSKKVAADKTLDSMDQAVWAYRNGDLRGWNDYRRAAIEETRNTYLHDLDPNETDPQRISEGRQRIEAEVAKTNGKIVLDTTKLILDDAKGGPEKAGQFAKEYEKEVDAATNVKIDDMLKGARATQYGQDKADQALGRSRMPAGSVAGIPANFVAGIKATEGYQPRAQWDYKQFTNGYGTRAAHSAEVIDRDTAEQRFNNEISRAAKFVDGVNPNLDPGTRAALTSLTFNAGSDWAHSGLGQKIRAGDIAGAKADFLAYNHAGGVVDQGLANRRAREVQWFGRDDVAPGEAPQVASYQGGGAGAAPSTGEAPQDAAVSSPAAAAHAIDFRAAERKLLDDPELQGNPQAQAAAFARLNRVKQVTEGQQADEERAQRMAEHAAKVASDTAEQEALHDIYSNKPTLTAPQIIDSPVLSREAKERLITQLSKADTGEHAERTYGPGFFDAYKQVHAPPGDPGRITDPSQLYGMVGPRGSLTVAGVDKLVSEINAKKTPQGEAETSAMKQFMEHVARPQITFTDEVLKLKDKDGDENFLRFQAGAFNAFDEGKKAGKTWQQLLNPDSPDYIGKMIEQFKPKADQSFANRLQDASTNGPGFFSRIGTAIGNVVYPAAAPAPAPFDAAQVHSLAELQAAYRDRRIGADEARKFAIERGWARVPVAPPQVPSTP